jgi:CubicO group peptidase (beta-lactamase class C family)
MGDTDFFVPDEKRNRLVHVYAPEDINNPAPQSLPGQPSWKISETMYFGIPFEYLGRPGRRESGGGGLFSSPADYLRYASAIALGGELGGVRILGEETVKLHFTNLMPDLGLEAFEAAFGPSAKFMQFAGGFGIKLEGDGSGKPDYAFWGGAANTFFWVDRDREIAGLFFSHISPPRYNVIEDIEQAVDLAFEKN